MSEDRHRTMVIKGKKVNFTFLDADNLPPLERVTSVAVVPFNQDGDIIATLLRDRGIDLPGGHMKVGETTFEETARREANEEAFITLGSLSVACVIQSDYKGSAPEQLTYMVIMTGLVEAMHEEKPDEESAGRKTISLENFMKEYTAGDKSFMSKILYHAQEAYRKTHPPKVIEKIMDKKNFSP